VSETQATVSGIVNTDNGSSLTARGICYNTSNNPTIANLKKADATPALGSFSCTLDNLSPGTTYFTRAYATNSNGTAYGTEISFKTKEATIPIISSTIAVNSIATTTAQSGATITHSGVSSVTSRGVCYSSTSIIPTITDTKTVDGTGIGAFTSSLIGLTPNTIYYVRAYATNALGTAYGDVKTFSTTTVTIPTGITTTSLAFITQSAAAAGGNIIGDGGATITSRGVCYSSTSTLPSIIDTKTIDGNGIGTFSSSLTGLLQGTTYYVRAYATNSVGTAYGSAISFTTSSATIPTVTTTTTLAFITLSTAAGGGNIIGDGGSAITSRGVCYSSTSGLPTISDTKTVDGNGIGTFTSSLTGLSQGTTYYVRAYATNSVGTAYGSAVSFITLSATIPNGITTTSASSITQTTAYSGGSITSDGGSTITSKGVCWSNTTSAPTISGSKTNDGSGTGSFTSSLSGLLAGTTYYIRAYVTNSMGTAYGAATSFTTSAATKIPSGITTTSASSITQSTAYSGGSISSDGGSTITSKGVCWGTTSTPTISGSKTNDGSGTGSFTSSLSGLSTNTTYYVRAYATNSVGTSYGTAISFTTTTSSIVVGQSYQGGIVAYIFKSGDTGYVSGQTHGLIAAPVNQSTGTTWGCSGTSISTSTSLGTGKSNTTSIVSICPTSSTAAEICYDLILGGYSDWYLPSLNELIQLYNNSYSIGGLNGEYWSSSQYSSSNANTFNFDDGYSDYWSKSSSYKVRAVRTF
jgi:hypothetical protein